MATLDECEAAVAGLAERLAAVDPDLRKRHAANRTLALTLTDLRTTLFAELRDGLLLDSERPPGPAHIRLATSSDDLLAVVRGDLSLPSAVASGRLRVDASLKDLLKLRTFL